MQDNAVLLDRKGRVGVITLNKPAKLNAWDRPMRDEIVAALRAYDADARIGAVVMTGTGERAFSAGQDFAEAHGFDEDRAEEWIREWETFYGLLRSLTKPIVMALNGTAAARRSRSPCSATSGSALGRDDGPARDQQRHRQHHRPVDHEGDPRHVAHDRAHAHRPHDGGRRVRAHRPDPPPGAREQVLPKSLEIGEQLAARRAGDAHRPGLVPRDDRGGFRHTIEAGDPLPSPVVRLGRAGAQDGRSSWPLRGHELG
jgi:hypothetical protein